MQDLRCKDCGQRFKTPAELQEHEERTHGASKMGGEPMARESQDGEPRR